MQESHWFHGVFGTTPCRIAVTRYGETWTAEAFATEPGGGLIPVLKPNGEAQRFPVARKDRDRSGPRSARYVGVRAGTPRLEVPVPRTTFYV